MLAAYMPLKLSIKQLAERDDIVARLRTAGTDLDAAIIQFNDALDAARMAIEPHVDTYEDALQAARTFAAKIASDMQEAIDARSARWQESENGHAAVMLQQAWEGLDLEPVDLAIPDDLDGPNLEAADDLADAPAEPV